MSRHTHIPVPSAGLAGRKTRHGGSGYHPAAAIGSADSATSAARKHRALLAANPAGAASRWRSRSGRLPAPMATGCPRSE